VVAISRAVAIARARASFALRVSDRCAEYRARFVCGDAERVTVVRWMVAFLTGAASLDGTAIQTRPRSAKGAIEQRGFVLNWVTRTCASLRR